MRILAAVVVVVILAGVALWATGVLPIGNTARVPAKPSLFTALSSGDAGAVTTALEGGADVFARDVDGYTPLMAAVRGNATTATLDALLAAGAGIDEITVNGTSALMLAAGSGTPAQVIHLLNAGADPTLADTEGRNSADIARQNSAVRSSGVFPRLLEAASMPFVKGWPSGYVVPVEGATISSRRNHLPGAPRAYRNGYHEGFDFYNGTVSVNIGYGTPIVAVADGVVIRADHDYVENDLTAYNALIDEAARGLDTPPEILDRLRGRQVWLRHPGGFVTRYAHLSAVAEKVTIGGTVRQGDIIGSTGNSGTLEAAQGTQDDPHPHVEVWRGSETYLGAGLEPEQIWDLAAQVFGTSALPPYHD
ncbi:MAG TPA: peptidoglycan DD-metalloendopeptidase family protein [Trueperaceae bacterium]|nr:peptidoglycan DD-metalloendopeptidase family protein [Trueperaceae bacterium]